MHSANRWILLAVLGTLGICGELAGGSLAVAAETGSGALAELSLEQLSEIEVFSASRQLEPTAGVPSAIFVLTGEDLRRSGITSIPEALRLVPGVQVGRVDANKWAVSMRGFNFRGANKLLVLVDGRSIYDPLFSGMLWESHDFLLEDIERIEVIRGPGGTLWGANAFHGIINIVTKAAGETQGTLASLTLGDEERYIASARYGWRPTERQDARVYVKARERDEGYSAIAPPADDSRDVRGGFRWDWTNGPGDALLVSGDFFEATAGVRENQALVQDVEHRGGNLLARWTRQIGSTSGWRVQAYFDRVDYESSAFLQDRDTFDLDLQQNIRLAGRHLVVWGGNYRQMRDEAATTLRGFIDVLPAERDDERISIFAQDTIALVADTLDLTLGLKYEDTDYADSEWLPNARLAWTPAATQTWWLAVSEATRVPSRLEADLTFLGTLRIGDTFGAEHVRAYEAGVRRLISSRIWYDVAVFYNDYDDLRSSEANGTLSNLMYGHSRGAELAVRYELVPGWRLDASYTYMDSDLALERTSTAPRSLVALTEGLTPRHQAAVRAILDLRRDWQADATLRYVDELPALGFSDYTQLDLALHWRPSAAWELSVVGQNLLDGHQAEQGFVFSGSMPTEAERGAYARVTWRY